jgi:hypothetical protein
MTALTAKSILFRRQVMGFTAITKRRLDIRLPAHVRSEKKFITFTGYDPLFNYENQRITNE